MKLKNLSALALLGAGLIIGNSALAQWTRVGSKTYVTNVGDSIGIGTTNPAYKVDIQSTGIATMSLKSTTSNSNILFDRKTAANNATLTYRTNGVNNWQTGTLGNNHYILKNNSLNSVAIYCDYLTNNVGIGSAAPTNKLSVTGNANFTGNVGIGNTAPVNKLSVTGNADFTGFVGIGTNSPLQKLHVKGAGDQEIYIESTDPGAHIWSFQSNGNSGQSTFQIIDRTSTVSRLGIDNNGNVGIGTTTPGAKLEVAGQVKITGGTPGTGKVLTSDANGLASWTVPASGGLANGSSAGNTPYWNGTSWISNSSNIFNNGGNVGIGTTSPTTKLDIAGNIKITDGTQGANKVLQCDATGKAHWATPGSTMQGGNNTATQLVTSSFTVPAGVYSVNMEAVGGSGGGGGSGSAKGTSFPSFAQSGAGGGGGGGEYGSMILAVNPGDVISVTLGTAGAAGTGGVGQNVNGTDGTNGGATTVKLNGATVFSVNGGSKGMGGQAVTCQSCNGTNGAGGSGGSGSSVALEIAGQAGGSLTGGASSLVNNGTSVNGGDGAIYVFASSTTVVNGINGHAGLPGQVAVSYVSSTANAIPFKKGAVIFAGGGGALSSNYNFNWDNTNSRLNVGGKIYCTELKVQVQPFPDYVFASDYKLKSISEVENHIKTYSRLPDMPSATEVETNGMDVGVMQAKVVEKVEELTLYIIQQQKQIDELKAQLESQKR